MKTRVSKAYRADQHYGWKKTVGGKSWFLGCGTTPASEAKAIALAEILEAKWMLAKVAGQSELFQTDLDDAKALLEGRPRWALARDEGWVQSALAASPPKPVEAPVTAAVVATVAVPQIEVGAPAQRRWLFASLDEFVASVMKSLRSDGSNGDHVFNSCERVQRARDAIVDTPLDRLDRKALEDWLLAIRSLRSKHTGGPIQAVTIRNLTGGVRVALKRLIGWGWWSPPLLWEEAFEGYTTKKLQTPIERKRKRQRPPSHSVAEKRVIWHLAAPFEKAMMGLADWAGHTQMEISTITIDEIHDVDGEMVIDRDRHKTGVRGTWWIPPEAAVWIRKAVARTPRDLQINPLGLAFLTPRNMPLVHRANKNKKARSDYVGGNIWSKLLRASAPYGVRHISFKYMRKGTAQLIRDRWGKEVSRSFLAHADEDVQDENYTRPNLTTVTTALRELYAVQKEMFEPIRPGEWQALSDRIRRENGLPADQGTNEAA